MTKSFTETVAQALVTVNCPLYSTIIHSVMPAAPRNAAQQQLCTVTGLPLGHKRQRRLQMYSGRIAAWQKQLQQNMRTAALSCTLLALALHKAAHAHRALPVIQADCATWCHLSNSPSLHVSTWPPHPCATRYGLCTACTQESSASAAKIATAAL